MGLCNFSNLKISGMGLNEAAVQYMTSKVIGIQKDYVKYFGISFETISSKPSGKTVALIVTALGTIGAVFLPMDNITDFLYLIGSVFAPMISIQIADFFVLKNDSSAKNIDLQKAVIWVLGFALYRISLSWNFILGNTLPVMLIIFAVTVAAQKILGKKK